MGWSARRSFKLGPTRLNLSSRGIGTSIGVRGFRLGVSGGGRTYVRGGRGMFRYEKTLGARSSRAAEAPSALGCGILLVLLFGGFATIVLVVVLNSVFQSIPETASHSGALILITLVGLFLAALWLFRETRRLDARRKHEQQVAIDGFRAAVEALSRTADPTQEDAQHIAALRERLPPGMVDLEAAYRAAVADVIRDQAVTPQETRRLGLLATAFGLTSDSVHRANLGGFVEAFYALVSDGKLTEDEDVKLAQLPAALGVTEDEIQPYLVKAVQLRRAREVTNAPELIPLSTDVRLKKGESCIYSTPATEIRFYSDGDDRPVKCGTLYATSQRLLFLGDGTRTIKYDSILRVGVEAKRSGEALSLAIESRKEPLYFDVPEPFVLAAYIERLSAQAA